MAIPPFGYGFLGGTFAANEDAGISTWCDIHYGCHFRTAGELQHWIDAVGAHNSVLVGLSAAWQARDVTCEMKGPWGNASLAIGRIAPLIPTFEHNRNRLFAVWLFDEPDVKHGGPQSTELCIAVNYLHDTLPEVPVFINWFDPLKNRRVPDADWYSTTKGKSVSALAKLRKPMFLWWFNNQSNLSSKTVRSRWNKFVVYTETHRQPPIASLGWCCESILLPDPTLSIRTRERRVLLAKIGTMIRQGRLEKI